MTEARRSTVTSWAATASVVLCALVGGCTNTGAKPPSTTDPVPTTPVVASSASPCAADEVAVAVRFAKAVVAHDVATSSACESSTSKPDANNVDSLAGFGPLLFDRASAQNGGTAVNIPAPDSPNIGDLPPHVCGVTIEGQFETRGWFVTGVGIYCSS